MMIDIRISKGDGSWHENEIGYRHTVDKIELENLVPKEMFPGMSLFDLLDVQRSEELRRKFIDMMSSKIAYSLTDYLINQYKKNEKVYNISFEVGKNVMKDTIPK